MTGCHTPRPWLYSLAVAVALLLAALTPTGAAAASPWWHLGAVARPARIEPGGKGTVVATAINLGDEPTAGPTSVSVTLPAGVIVGELAGVPQISFFATPIAAGGTDVGLTAGLELCALSGSTATCTLPGIPLAPYENLEMRVGVEDLAAAPGSYRVEASGGHAATASLERPFLVSGEPTPFGADRYDLVPEEEGGIAGDRAGSHPYQLTTDLSLDQLAETVNGSGGRAVRSPAVPKDLQFKLPPGLVGNATVLPKCNQIEFTSFLSGDANRCPPDTTVGVATISFQDENNLGLRTLPVPLVNLEPGPGEPARFGFEVAKGIVTLDTSLRSGIHGGRPEDYGVSVSASNLTQLVSFFSSTVTFWGTPGAQSHDESRGWGCLIGGFWLAPHGSCSTASEPSPRALLTLPTDCGEPFRTEVGGDSWPDKTHPQGLIAEPLVYSLLDGFGAPLGLVGCEGLAFSPQIASQPTTGAAAAPSGLTFDLSFGDEGLENPAGSAESAIRKAVVTLPAGITTNPSVAGGLSSCSQGSYEEENLESEAGCPESSKIGEVEIESPLVEPIIRGSIYVAAQGANPNHNLLTIYMVAKNPALGVLVRSAGAVTPDQRTGQLTTTFDELPQLPFTHFHLAFHTGQRAPLITPGLCGRYSAQADLYPYSAPNAPLHREASFEVTAGADGRPCATQESQLPNKPTLEAGTLSPIAGAYSPFVFKVKREDGSQVLSTITATLPEGLLGKLAGLSECSNAQIAQAESRSGEGQGALELAGPSCPASSEVGTVDVGTGVGTQPYHVQGKAYLAGPYKGAPLSLAIITPAVVGPFDLGTIVVRTALYVNETTAQITAKSDPVPTIVHGLPTVVQSISLNMNRPAFTLNPTSCDPKQIEGSATSTLGNVASLTQRFQVGACNALAFKPTLKLFFSGQTKRTGNPALRAVLTQPKGDNANIARTSVVLPKGMLIANAHISNPCTRVQFNSRPVPGEACPPKSVLGHAKVWTPLLEAPEEGPVYFRSNGGERELPDLVVALRGKIPVRLVGFIDSVGKKGAEVRRVRTRFQSVPDAPISRFELKLSGGKKGLLENSQNFCKAKQQAKFQLTGQNGKAYDTEPAVQVSCGKGKKKAGKGKNGK